MTVRHKHNDFRKLLDGRGTFSCRLPRPRKTPVILTCLRTVHCREGESLSRAFTALLTDVFGFHGDGVCWEPQQHAALPSPTSPAQQPTLTISTSPSELGLARHCHSTNLCLRHQTSTESDICKDNHSNHSMRNCCTLSFQYWVKERDKYPGLACRYFSKTVIAA